ncbi:hypothetical protein D3C73_1618920 [compost metagenome]
MGATTIAVVVKTKTLLHFQHPRIGTPTGNRRTFDRLTGTVGQRIHTELNLLHQLRF